MHPSTANRHPARPARIARKTRAEAAIAGNYRNWPAFTAHFIVCAPRLTVTPVLAHRLLNTSRPRNVLRAQRRIELIRRSLYRH